MKITVLEALQGTKYLVRNKGIFKDDSLVLPGDFVNSIIPKTLQHSLLPSQTAVVILINGGYSLKQYGNTITYFVTDLFTGTNRIPYRDFIKWSQRWQFKIPPKLFEGVLTNTIHEKYMYGDSVLNNQIKRFGCVILGTEETYWKEYRSGN